MMVPGNGQDWHVLFFHGHFLGWGRRLFGWLPRGMRHVVLLTPAGPEAPGLWIQVEKTAGGVVVLPLTAAEAQALAAKATLVHVTTARDRRRRPWFGLLGCVQLANDILGTEAVTPLGLHRQLSRR